MSNIDNLNFEVILSDSDFNTKINRDIELAKHLNTSVSSLLDIKSKIPQNTKVAIDTKEAEISLEKLNAHFADLEKADWSKIGQKLDVTPQVNQAILQLKKLQDEIDVIQELRQESGGDSALATELKRAQEEANKLLATIAELRKTENAVNAPSQFKSFVQSLTEQTMEQKQMIEYYKAEEAASRKVAEEKSKEEKARKKNAEAIEKERRAQAKGEFKEYVQSLTTTNPELKAMAQYYRELEQATAKNAQAAQGAALHQKSLNKQLEMTSRLGQELKGILAGVFSLYGAKALISNLVRVTGEFELQKVSLGAILHDLDKAESIIRDIKGLAVESPFQFKELTTYAKQLSAFSVPAEELFETTKMLADVSAGLGVGMDRLVLAYGQVRSAAFLRGQEVRQFTEAGIPILDELAKKFSEVEDTAVSTGEVFDRISARQVPFEMVAEIFKEMTSEGGKFFKMQEVQAETLKGKINNLKDAYEIMLNEIGESNSNALKAGVDKVRELLNNWESIGQSLKRLITLFGVYKVTVSLVRISDQIAQYGSLAKAIKGCAAAQKLLNSALLTNPYAAAAVAITMLVIGISSAVKESRAFRQEMEGISNTRLDEALDSVNRFEELVNNLNNAKEGSEGFRNAIAKLNSEYGEYLPNLLTEKNALDEIKASSDAVTRSIYARAKAKAYEQGIQKIEERYGTSKDEYAAEFINQLVDDGITREAARKLFKAFTEEIEKQEDGWNPAEVFNKVYSEYFKTDEKYFTDFGNFLNDVKQSTPFMRNIYGVNTTGWQTARDALWNYSLVLNEVNEAEQKNADIIESKFAESTYNPEEEKAAIEEITSRYNKLKEAQLGVTQSKEQYNNAIRNLDIARLKEEMEVYKKLGRTDIVNDLKEQLKELEVTATGWRKTVIDILTLGGLTQTTAGGLWPSAKTGTLEYGKNLIQETKELKDGLHYITDQDKELTQSYQNRLQIAEKIAKILNISKPAKGGKKESKEEKALKRRIEALRTLQKDYEDLKKLGASDESIKTLFKGMYPDLIKENGEDFVTDLNYLDRAVKLAETLAKKNPEAARKALMSIGADQVTQYKKLLEELNNSYEKSAKSAEKFFEAMRKWKTEDFNIEGKGIIFDLQKIASNLTETNNEIDLKAKKIKESLASIIKPDIRENITLALNVDFAKYKTPALMEELRRAEDIDIIPTITQRLGKDVAEQLVSGSIKGFDTIKKTFIQEFGEDGWSEFFDMLLTEGGRAIDKFTQRAKNFEKALAQNDIEELAQKQVSDMVKPLNLGDWGDKSLRQIQEVRAALKEMMDGDVIVDNNTITRLQQLGLTLEDFEDIVDALLSKKFGEAVDEEMKKAQSAAQSFAGIIGGIGDAFATMGDATGNEVVEGIGEALNVTEELAVAILECEAIWDAVGDAAKATGDATGEVAKAAGGLVSSLSIITMVVKVVLIIIEQIANAIGRASQAQREMYMAALQYAEVMNELQLSQADTYFGENYFEKIKLQAEDTTEALNNLNNIYKQLEREGFDRHMTSKKINDLIWLRAKLVAQGKLNPNADIYETVKAIQLYRTELENARKKTEGYKLGKGIKGDIEILMEYLAAYEKALEAFKESIQSLFGDLANDIASNMIDAFLQTGDALSNLEDSFRSLGKTILTSLLQSFIIDQILTKYEDRLADIMLQYANGYRSPDLLNLFLQDVKKDLEGYSNFINDFIKSWNEVIGLGEQDSNTLADGIKGITEDTGNLLASYLNAIRADISSAKVIWEQLNINTQRIVSILSSFSLPNLMEYQMQIAANTYNTAMHTEQIMRDLQNVLTSEGGARAIRIYS